MVRDKFITTPSNTEKKLIAETMEVRAILTWTNIAIFLNEN